MDYNKMFEKWLDDLGEAWVSRNPNIAASLCAENVKYYEHPFQNPAIGREEVRSIWLDVPRTQKDVNFESSTIMVKGNTGIARWKASWTNIKDGSRSELDGIFLVTLDEQGLCKEFHQWWVTK